ncbi:MAG: UDP-4-amino-4,6-dideoxy-N-acetyl-beta-L-altrosamine transaminase [Pseudomonadota bacterium]
MIPYGRQHITDDDIQAVEKILRSDFLTQGPAVPAFEAELCKATGSQYASAVNSATSALHIACLALRLGRGGMLWTAPNTFVASANVALLCGAQVDFVDIDPATRNMSVDALKQKLETSERRPDILMPVHFAGRSCEMAEIADLAKIYGFKIIEDASHAVGGSYRGSPIGRCVYSDIAVFSFHPVKIVTTGEGGAALTNDPELDDRLKVLRTHGVTRDPRLMETTNAAPWEYDQLELGLNYRMADIAAALGTSQMSRLESYVARRKELAGRYNSAFEASGFGDQLGLPPLDDLEIHQSAWHLYTVEVPARVNKRRLFEALREAGVGVNVHYQPVHLQPYYRRLNFSEGDFPNAEEYYRRALTLPLHPQVTEEEQDKVVNLLLEQL